MDSDYVLPVVRDEKDAISLDRSVIFSSLLKGKFEGRCHQIRNESIAVILHKHSGIKIFQLALLFCVYKQQTTLDVWLFHYISKIWNY